MKFSHSFTQCRLAIDGNGDNGAWSHPEKKSQGSLPSASKYDLAKTMAWNKSLEFPEIYHWSITRWHTENFTHPSLSPSSSSHHCTKILPQLTHGHGFSFNKNMTKHSVQFLLLLLMQTLPRQEIQWTITELPYLGMFLNKRQRVRVIVSFPLGGYWHF